ncbi:MAG: CinA family protein [Lautropia sp.]|nr:CinA family protein [Lautropia sp.]
MNDENLQEDLLAWGRLLGQRVEALGFGLIATAESCTGGLLASALTETAGSSGWFSRGYVTYANQAKIDMLGVDPDCLQAEGAVSLPVVRQMALGALQSSDILLSMAVSGVAGPGGGSPEKPVGTICFGWALRWPPGTDTPLLVAETMHFSGNRSEIREQVAIHALRRALQLLEQAQGDQPAAA